MNSLSVSIARGRLSATLATAALALLCGTLPFTTQHAAAQAQAATVPSSSDPWWKHAVVYEIYPRSYQDSTGDGIGDPGQLRPRHRGRVP